MSVKIKRQVGRRIRRLRKQKDMTQEKLAHEADIERSYMGYVERGQANPTLEKLSKIAKTLGVKIGDLFS